MNHQFRIVWSVARNAWVVVSEQVRSHVPGTTVLTAGAIALLETTQARAYTDPVGAGVTVTAEQVSSGIQHVTAGGVANRTEVLGTFTTVTSTNSSGGTVTSTVQLTSGGVAVSSGGLVSGTIVGRGGQVTISSGGVAQGTEIHSGGYDNVLNGGLAVSAWVTDNSRSYVNNGGVASATRIDHAGGQYVYGGGITYDAVISGGGGAFISLHAGTAIGTLVSAGGQLFLQTGSAGNVQILSGGLLTLQGINCVVTGATLSSGAALQANTDSTVTGSNALGSFTLVSGIASNALLENGGRLDVKSGGFASASVVNRGGTLNFLDGGSGSANTINSGGRLVVFAGGTALDVTQNSGGALVTNTNATVSGTNALGSFVVSNRNASDVLLENGGVLTVYAGGTASASVSKTGGYVIVSAGGVASATRILNGYEVIYQDGLSLQAVASAGGRQHISAGGSATSALIGASGGQRIYSGGVANQTTVSSGGFQEVSGGMTTNAVFNNGHQSLFSGIASDTTFNSGSQAITGGVASNTILNSGAVSTVSSSGMASATVINDRSTQTVLAGGQAAVTTVQSGGTQNISSGGTSLAAIIASGGSQAVFTGGMTSATSVQSDGVQRVSSGGSSFATSVDSGGSQTVAGMAQQTRVAGSQTVLAGGVASASMILSGGVQLLSAGGSDQGSVISSAGTQTVFAGASTTSAMVNGGASQWLSGGMATAATVNGGAQTVFAGGVASATILASGGVQTVSSGGTALGSLVQSGSVQVVSDGGNDLGSMIGSAGTQTVFAGATTTSATVNGGGVQQVSGGLVSAALIQGGTQNIVSGGVSVATVLGAGGLQSVQSAGVASGTVVQSGGVETIASAGVANATTVSSGGTVRLAAGANASGLDQQRGAALIVDMNALVAGSNALGSFQVGNGASQNVLLENGGSMDVVDGATASGSTVDSGGTLRVAAGGVLDGLTYIKGTGVLGGNSIINRGQLHLSPSANGVFNAVVRDSGSFYKDGTATLTLGAAQNYRGETWVTGGTLAAGVSDAIAASSGLTVQGPGRFDTGGHDQTVNHLRGDGSVVLGDATLTLVQTGGAETFAGTLTGKGNLVKNGAYSQTLSGKTAYTGQTQILAGTLVLDGRLGGAQLVSNVVGQSGATLSLINGAKLTGSIDPLDVGIDKSSSWVMTASSQLDSLTLAGFLDMQRPVGNFIPKTLLLNQLIGQNGVIAMNVALGDSLSTAGQIVIDGGAVTGSLRLGIRNIGGLGDLTSGEGIRLISTVNGGTTAGATVSEYRPVLAGIYDYALARGTANSDNWYLTSFDPNGQPRIRAEVPLYSVIPSVGLKYGNFLLSSLQERRGSTGMYSGAGGERGWWGRVLTQDNRYTGGSEGILGGGAHFHAKFSAAQYGYDLLDRQTSESEDRAGVYGAIGKSSTGVSRANGQTAGDMALNGYSVGAYWTRRSSRGWYLDGVMQVTWNQIKTSSVNGETLSTHAPGTILSIEGGYGFRPGLGLTVEPQLQLSWQRLFVAPSRDDAAEVEFGRVQSLPLRLGVKVSRDVTWPWAGKPLHVWMQPSLMHEFSSTQTTGFQAMNGNQSRLRSGLTGSGAVVAAGIAGELPHNLALDVKVDYHESLSGNHFHGYGVQLQVHGKI